MNKLDKTRKILYLISKILFTLFAIIFGISTLFSSMCKDPEVDQVLCGIFGSGSQETITTGKEPVYYKTWYQSVEDVMAGSGEYASVAEAEGAVLLKNETLSNGKTALPLNKDTDKVSLFGVTAYNPMYSVDGAGEIIVNSDRKQYFKTEMEKVGLTVNNDLATWYGNNTQYNRSSTSSNGVNVNINGAGWSDINTTAKTASGYKTAIYVIGRMGNEAIDLPPYSTGSGTAGLTDGDYLKLTAKEKNLLQGLKSAKDSGTFDRIIVLINAANPIQDNFIDNADYGIDAALWIGFPGSVGISAVADILVGKTTPSGRLPNTWYSSREQNPTWNNYGNFNNGNSYVLYQEGIYLGYKYAETRYEDYVLGTSGAGNYDYDSAINYTFGHGLSYTDFSYEFVSLQKDSDPSKNYDYAGNLKSEDLLRYTGEGGYSDDYIATVKVTNTGSTYSGKEVVQIYLQQPYTATNIAHKVEKSSVELVGFAKTKKLAPGESQTLEIKIDANKYFASYDSVANGYVLDVGTYYLTAAKDAHNAVNNILVAKNKADSTKMVGEGDADLVKSVEVTAFDSVAYSYWTQGGSAVSNLFDHADPNRADPNGNEITFMSRSNWEGTVFSSHQTVNSTTKRNAGRKLDGGGDFSNSKTNYPYYSDEYPTYGRVLDEHLNLSDMIGVEYEESRGATEEDIQKWNDFLDQLTWDETVLLVGSGRRCTQAIESINKPYTYDVNASNGISWKFNMSNGEMGFAGRFDSENSNIYPMGYPCEGIIAATFNTELAYVVGQSIGEDALWSGASGLYGFGVNMQRNPYHGRAGEYYSDDTFLTGVIAGWESLGAQSKGLYVYSKHFVLNDQEVNRTGYATWITEQALRQTHLRAFEIAIEIGDAMNVMTAFNRIGTYWSGNDYNLMTKCLREEFGMRGFAVTDWFRSAGMNMSNGILAGQDLPDGDGQSDLSGKGPGTGNGHVGQAMRVSAQRILYTVANSNAMNFFGDDTQVITYEPEWYSVRDGLITASTVIFIVSAVFVVGCGAWVYVPQIINKKKKDS
ncbi:MAG: glycoside hydrolase family 3 C-terminal domain-containing protein [Candidatus Coproplasma sp.]